MTVPIRFLEAERILIRRKSASAFHLYEALHEAASSIAQVDAFYLCLYEPERQFLHYVYNCDGEIFDTPEAFPLGDGPTSQVIRTGQMLIGHGSAKSTSQLPITFGNHQKRTLSSLHLPIALNSCSSGVPPLAVLSVQAYTADVYGPDEIVAFEWLALRAESLLREQRQAADTQSLLDDVREEAGSVQARSIVRRTINQLDALCKQVEQGIEGVTVTGARSLLRELHHMQVEASHWAYSAQPPTNETVDQPDLLSLTPREVEVLVYVAEGLTNPQIANALMISVDTVKGHVKSAFRKANFTTRQQVVMAAGSIRDHLATHLGDVKTP